jgi:hypothetical protein
VKRLASFHFPSAVLPTIWPTPVQIMKVSAIREEEKRRRQTKNDGANGRRLARNLTKLLNNPLAPRVTHPLSGVGILRHRLGNVTVARVGSDGGNGGSEVERGQVRRFKAEVDEVDDANDVRLEGGDRQVEVDAPGVLNGKRKSATQKERKKKLDEREGQRSPPA